MSNYAYPGPLNFYKDRFEIENNLTRTVLQSVPLGVAGYRPHEKSASTSEIAWTIVRGLYVRIDMADLGQSDVLTEHHPTFAEIVEQFEEASHRHAAQLKSWPETAWAKIGQLRIGGRVVQERSAGAIVWLFHFDEIHHRGQLSTYLRPMGAKVPSIYGPSGDFSR